MNASINDVILLVNLIKHAAGLIATMKDRGAETLTPEERAALGIPDDAARERLVAAIAKAGA